jgi:hypothetical protein
MPLNKDLREFLGLLNSNGVEYLIVGAFAVAFHGFPRYTADLDILVRPSAENASRVLRALSEFGFGTLGVRAEDLQTPGMVIQLGMQPSRIDVIDHHLRCEFRRGVGDGLRSRFGCYPHTLYRPCGFTSQQGEHRSRQRPW